MDILTPVKGAVNIKASIITSRILGMSRAAEPMPPLADRRQLELAAGRHG